MLKYIYMGTPAIAARILEKLCENEYPPALVVTQVAKPKGRGQKTMPSEVERYARTQDLSVIEAFDINSPGTADVLKTFHPDLILVVAFGQILKETVLTIPKSGCLNVHASLLPKYRGAAPVQRAIMAGERETGISIQKIVKKLDAGDILVQKKVAISPDETAGDLLNRLAEVGADALLEALKLVESRKAQFTPQVEEDASYAKKLEKSDANLDWSLPAWVLQNYVRGLQPWPVAQFPWNGEMIRIFKAKVVPGTPGSQVGVIRSDRKTFVEVQCGDGHALSLIEIQQEGRKRLKIEEFLMGYRWPSID
ncbi:MAG: methionyl-tRNA formyltransferase [Proteobacteria bacterium]|nr:methionyl-tRNA formyltransferase [Pseudomonadota bacterium]NDC22970.1 methionyl-tRNA formyltransferase [Pseudomonadota bacterium]NDD03427.1 methionyl-tRNA formyltransferase [Pseudomonadota bacterium]NDG25555.1 methionyl-tRNA formyltransferase [Pseudomonadota bacterium]